MHTATKGDPVALTVFLECWADSLHGLGAHASAPAFPAGIIEWTAKLADAACAAAAEIRRASAGTSSMVDAETASALVEISTRLSTFHAHLARIVSEWAVMPGEKSLTQEIGREKNL